MHPSLVNSYKRLVPGFEAPSEVTWSRTQRNALVHVRKEHGGEVNLELRSPDSASNPYLVFALCLAAGMEGIEKRLQVPEELTKDIRKLNEEEKKLLGIQMLPENLGALLGADGPVGHALCPVAGVHVLRDGIGGHGGGLDLVDDHRAVLIGKNAVGTALDGEPDDS